MIVREATLHDAVRITPWLRQADLEEIQAASGLDPLEALVSSWAHSNLRLVVCDDAGVPWFFSGCSNAPWGNGEGSPWAVATTAIRFHKRWLIEHTPALWSFSDQYFPVQRNFVDERNTAHIRWLRWSGCKIVRRHPTFGHEQRPFLEFVREAPCASTPCPCPWAPLAYRPSVDF